jgi:hypothetical protein
MITFKLKRNHWEFVAMRGNNYREVGPTVLETKQYVKEKFNGEFEMSRGFGSITFQTENELTWFLLATT